MRVQTIGSLALVVALSAGSVIASTWQAAPSAPASPATRPVRNDGLRPEPQNNAERMKLHEQHLARAKQGNVGLLFLGDSITAGWSTRAKDLFEAEYGKYRAANFGIGGDKTQNVLWRIDQGTLDGISPKVVVLMIGTNNTGANTADEITVAVGRVVERVKEKLPGTKVLLMGMLPRGPRNNPNGQPDTHEKKQAIITEVNARIAKLDDGKTVRFLDVGGKFVVDGKIPETVMPDQLHPNREGYTIWAEAMRPLLEEMMKE